MVCMCLLSALWSQWTLLAGIVIYVAYKWSTSTYDFFTKKNVEFEKPIPLFGNFKGIVFQTEPMFEVIKRIYLKFKDRKFFGLYELRKPLLVISDPELLKKLLIQDFDHFVNHRVILDGDLEPLSGNSLFALRNDRWRNMRITLSPAFTGSKMRIIFQLMEKCCQTAKDYLKKEAAKDRFAVIDMKDFITRFTNDVIASAAFGLEVNSLEDQNNEFYLKGKEGTNFKGFVLFKFMLYTNFYKLAKFLKLQTFSKEFTAYFNNIVLDTIKYRTENGLIRPDMINLLLEARSGKLKHSEQDNLKEESFAAVEESSVNKVQTNYKLTDADMVSQCFIFFFAGFETTSVLISFCAQELMENSDIQKKLIKEIDDAREKLNGQPMTYEVLNKMKYLDMVVSETLRKWPPSVAIDRECSKSYTFEGQRTNYRIEKGEYIWIPVAGLHRDPEYYPDPDKFDPERFSDENKSNIKPFTYLPFGAGPRNCIGSRFALMEAKAILYHLLSEFTFEISEKSTVPIALECAGFQMRAKGGCWIKLKLRN